MRVVRTDAHGALTSATIITFEQQDNVVSARYHGGDMANGYLIGHLVGWSLRFRYVRADGRGRLDAGISEGALERFPDGRLRLVEHFKVAHATRKRN